MSNKIELQSNNTDLANLLTQLNELPNTTLLPHAERHAAGGEDPISATAIGAIPVSEKGIPGGVATLDENGNLVQGSNGNSLDILNMEVISTSDIDEICSEGGE